MIVEGVFASAAGNMLTAMAAICDAHSAWSLFDDAAGTNKKVYECNTGSGYYYMVVDDNYSGYYTVALCDSWDAGSHVCDGQITTTYYHSKDGGLYRAWVSETRIIFADVGGSPVYSRVSYHGYTVPHPSSDRILITGGGTSTTYDSGTHIRDGTGHAWRALYDPLGSVNVQLYLLGRVNDPGCLYRYNRDKDGFFHFRPRHIYAYGGTTRHSCGALDGVLPAGYVADDRLNNFEVVVCDGVMWQFHQDASYGCWVRMV